MAVTLNALTTGVGGLQTTGDTSGAIQLQSNGTATLTVDASGNVGIGTTSPSTYGKFAISNSSGTSVDINSSAKSSSSVTKDLQISRSSSSTSIAAAPNIYFTDGTSTNDNVIQCGSGNLQFWNFSANAWNERMRIDSSGNLLFNSGYGSAATAYGCRAWVKFNGTGVVAINGSGNVTSITDNGVGDYTINFTSAMPDTNYSVVSGNNWSGTGAFITINPNTPIYSTTQVKLAVIDRLGAAQDVSIVTSAIFR